MPCTRQGERPTHQVTGEHRGLGWGRWKRVKTQTGSHFGPPSSGQGSGESSSRKGICSSALCLSSPSALVGSSRHSSALHLLDVRLSSRSLKQMETSTFLSKTQSQTKTTITKQTTLVLWPSAHPFSPQHLPTATRQIRTDILQTRLCQAWFCPNQAVHSRETESPFLSLTLCL